MSDEVRAVIRGFVTAVAVVTAVLAVVPWTFLLIDAYMKWVWSFF